MQIFTNPNYDFVKWRIHAVIFSLIFIGIGVALFVTRGINLGIDFAGGANIVLKFREAVPLDELRRDLPQGATIQQYGAAKENSVLLRLPALKGEADYSGNVVKGLIAKFNPEAASKHDLNYEGRDTLAQLLIANDPDKRGTAGAADYQSLAARIIDERSRLGIFTSMSQVTSVQGVSSATANVLGQKTFLGDFNVLNQETVGPQVGGELRSKAIWAVILSSLAMGVYISIRFDVIFGVSAMICIVHDVLIAMAFLLMMNFEFSLNVVAALLLIVGYSINDTVVTYDRVRENSRKSKTKTSLADALNLASNQTLSRTILTSGTVFLVLLALLILGGEVIRVFSWILTIGIISGTYSTLLIVPAVAVAWDRWRESRGKKVPVAATSRPAEPVRREEPRKRRAV